MNLAGRSGRVVFDHCAVEYAEFWIRKEHGMVRALAAKDKSARLEAVRRAAGYFKIARNFPLSFDARRGRPRLAPVLDLLDGAKPRPTPATVVDVVDSFARRLGAAYGGRILVSAATKLLWLLYKDPVVIFDSQARLALSASSAGYGEYLERWLSGYAGCAAAIQEACESLQRNRVLACEAGPRWSRIAADTKREWFRRRVYDIHLWNMGAP